MTATTCLDEIIQGVRADVARAKQEAEREAEARAKHEVAETLASWRQCVAAAERRYPLFAGQFPEYPPCDFGIKSVIGYLPVQKFRSVTPINDGPEVPILHVEMLRYTQDCHWRAVDLLIQGPKASERWTCDDEDDAIAAIRRIFELHEDPLTL